MILTYMYPSVWNFKTVKFNKDVYFYSAASLPWILVSFYGFFFAFKSHSPLKWIFWSLVFSIILCRAEIIIITGRWGVILLTLHGACAWNSRDKIFNNVGWELRKIRYTFTIHEKIYNTRGQETLLQHLTSNDLYFRFVLRGFLAIKKQNIAA